MNKQLDWEKRFYKWVEDSDNATAQIRFHTKELKSFITSEKQLSVTETLEKVKEMLVEKENSLSVASGSEGGSDDFCDGYESGLNEAFELIDELTQQLSQLNIKEEE